MTGSGGGRTRHSGLRAGTAQGGPSVDARPGARCFSEKFERVVGCSHLSGLCCGQKIAAGPYGSSKVRTTSKRRAWGTLGQTGFPDLVSSTVAPYFPLTTYAFNDLAGSAAAYAAAPPGAL